jgi:hypothetical protein
LTLGHRCKLAAGCFQLEVLRPALKPHSRSTGVPCDLIAFERRHDRAIEIDEHDCFRRSDRHTSLGQAFEVNGFHDGRRSTFGIGL